MNDLHTMPAERADPIGDAAHSPVKGLVHRHQGRVLFKIVHVCPVYCRFCFRRETVGPNGDGGLSSGEIDAALAYIAGHREISEVILTGGDPFVLSARRAGDLVSQLAEIPHVKILRWHTRVPVVEPARVTRDFAGALKHKGVVSFVVIHANHPRELTDAARGAFARLSEAGLTLLSQSVLLRGVNDDADILASLMRGLVEAGVKPYYLHHPDLAPGTSHFRLSIEEGQVLMAGLRARVSGLAVPSYVLDIPGGFGKVPLEPSSVEYTQKGPRVRDTAGLWHDYTE